MILSSQVKLSILDLSPITTDSGVSQALHNSLELAQCAEQWNYHRYWLAEHHNMASNASSATAVLISYIAGSTRTIRVGSGGIMLPNHAPLVIAEQFGTLALLYPGRIDLGLGSAPPMDTPTTHALRRNVNTGSEDFFQNIIELQSYLGEPAPDQKVKAIPGQNTHVPLWILGSGLNGAKLAASLGLPFAFASHFAPDMLLPALECYRNNFRPSEVLEKPYVLICINVAAADDDMQAQYLFTSRQQQLLSLSKGNAVPLQTPTENLNAICSPQEKSALEQALRLSVVGDPQKIVQQLNVLLNQTKADEVMIISQIHDQHARLRSFEIMASIANQLHY